MYGIYANVKSVTLERLFGAPFRAGCYMVSDMIEGPWFYIMDDFGNAVSLPIR